MIKTKSLRTYMILQTINIKMALLPHAFWEEAVKVWLWLHIILKEKNG